MSLLDKWNKKRFSVFESDEKSVLELVEDINNFNKEIVTEVDTKTDLRGNHLGSWQGLNKPTMSEEGMRATVEKLNDETIPSINQQLSSIAQMTINDLSNIDAINEKISLFSGGKIIVNYSGNIEKPLILNEKNNIDIEFTKGKEIKINKHGWTALEIINSNNITVRNANLIGGGNFLDKNYNGTTGGGEKQYSTANGVSWGYVRNDNTKILGSYNNGYIGNSGSGIYVENSHNILIENNDISDFNYCGVTVQGGTSTNITIRDNKIHDCYDGGISLRDVDGYSVYSNEINNIGHPNTSNGDVTVDPGYGITLRASFNNDCAKNGNIYNNKIVNAKRKGIDSHSASYSNIYANIIDSSLVGGIHLTGTDGLQENVIIRDNILKNCGIATLETALVDSKISLYSKYKNVDIINNKIYEGGRNGSILVSGNNVNVKDNLIENTNFTPPEYSYAIKLQNTTNVLLDNNKSNGSYSRGIEIDSLENSSIINNKLLESIPIVEKTSPINTTFYGNSFTKPYLNKNTINYKRYVFDITYNGTTSPQIDVINYDGKLSYTVTSSGSGYGFRFLTNGILNTTLSPLCYSEIIPKTLYSTNIKQFIPISATAGSDLLFTCSIRNTLDSEYVISHDDLIGLKVRYIINIPIEI